jgi:hypothetical protein
MTTRLPAIVLTAVALTLALAGPATSQGNRTTLAAATTKGSFLTPLPSRFFMSPEDPRVPRVCRQTSNLIKCPLFLSYGGRADDLPTIDPAFTSNLPHVRVTMVAQRMENQIVASGGVDLGVDYAWPWVTSSSSTAADVESDPAGYILPKPGEVWIDEGIWLIRLYDALVFNACETFSGFPIDHTSSILKSDGSELGVFHGVDNSTVDELGYYNFQYTIRVEGDGGRISDFHFSGKVRVICSGLNDVP